MTLWDKIQTLLEDEEVRSAVTPQEELTAWFDGLRSMIDDDGAKPFDGLESALEWFVEVDSDILQALAEFAKDDRVLRDFLELGETLLDDVIQDIN